MIKIMFVCYGNICRSPMAEFLMKKMVEDLGEENKFFIESSATSSEEIGSPVYYGTAEILDRLNIDYSKKRAKKLTLSDYDKYDYFVGMDEYNRRAMQRIFNGDAKGKVSLVLDYTATPRDVSDPWYTRDFEKTYQDLVLGLNEFYKFLKTNNG